MKRNHEENDCVRVLTNKCHLNIDGRTKTIRGSRNQVIGNKAWGRIDYLMKVHKYIFMWDNNNVLLKAQNPDEKKQFNKTKKIIKKMKKDDNLGKPSKKR